MDDRLEAAQMTTCGCKRFPIKCIRVCPHKNRKIGVSGENKHALRDIRKKHVKRFNHYQQLIN